MDMPYSVSAHWPGDFDETGLRAWAENLRGQLAGRRISVGLVFMTPRFFPHAAQVLEILRVHAQIPLLAGCSSASLISGASEIEDNAGLALGLYALPGGELTAFHFTETDVEQAGDADFWPARSGVSAGETNGWLVFADPFHLDGEQWLASWNRAYAPLPVVGGLASGDYSEQRTQVYLNGDVFEEGGVAIAISGGVKILGVISQGCTPIGETWTLTRVEQNLIHQIGNRPAFDVLSETFERLSAEEKQNLPGNLHVGLVVNEYQEDFHRGDFLIRNLLGVDPRSGAIAVGAIPRAGQTLQFQRRDAAAAAEDMRAVLADAREKLAGATVYGGCLCSCNGRGRGLFGQPDHDAHTIQEQFGPFGLAGFFCNGEIGPVGQSNFLHGYTAALALFVKKD